MYTGDMMKTNLYFAYGMNTNLDSMAHRCPGAECLGPAILAQHRFRFAVHADVVPDPDQFVDGVLWRITETHLASLDLLEGFPEYYDRKLVTVLNSHGIQPAITYFMQPGAPDAVPGSGYLNMCLAGYRQNGVSAQQIHDWLRVNDSVDTNLI